MQINPETGELTLPSGTMLSSRLTRSAFLASLEGRNAQVSVRNEPWCSFHLEDRQDSLVVVVFFKGESLESVSLTIHDLRFGTNWDNWSEQRELERKQANDQWLKSKGLSPTKRYSWGSVWSGYSPRDGFSHILIRYELRNE